MKRPIRRVRTRSAHFWLVQDQGEVHIYPDSKHPPSQTLSVFGSPYWEGMWASCADEFRRHFKVRFPSKPIRVRITIDRLSD